MESIKASEVRIGNWLRFDNGIGNSHDYQVTPRFFASSMMNEDFEVNLYHKPIPLSEEWLLKFGFEKWTWCDDCAFIDLFFGDSLYCRFYNNQWHIKRMKVGRDSKGVFGKSEGKYVLPKGKIKYVHQLQNLYFTLTGKELTLNQ